MKRLAILALAISTVAAQAQLYGVGSNGNNYSFVQINTTTGAATQLFTFSLPGTTNVLALTYIPSTNKFITTGQINAFNSQLVEIDLGAQTATVVTSGIPTTYFEGVEYSVAQGGLAVAYGPGGFFTGSLALLNTTTYGLISSNNLTTLPDADTVFADSAGDLYVMDSNNPGPNGFMRNRVNNPFGASSLTGVGLNMFGGGDADFAWKADEGRLFLTQSSNLAEVNPASTLITPIGTYNNAGQAFRITGITAVPVPEPASMLAMGLGVAGAALRRRARKG